MRVLGIRTLKHGSWFKQNKNIGLVSLFTIFLYQNNTHRRQFPLILLCAGFSVTPTSAYDLAQRIYSAVYRCQLVYNSGHKNETICLRTV